MVATMPKPGDVTDSTSITSAVAAATSRFGAIDALLDNAGYRASGPLESFEMERIRRQFDTSVFGLLEVAKAVLPHMRERKSGAIVNISSIGGQMTFPLGTLYHGTKFAVEGMSESLHYELETVGIKVKIVEPGMIATEFSGRSFDFANDPAMDEYQPIVGTFMGAMGSDAMKPSAPELMLKRCSPNARTRMMRPSSQASSSNSGSDILPLAPYPVAARDLGDPVPGCDVLHTGCVGKCVQRSTANPLFPMQPRKLEA